jgi:alpha-1,2-mannosyltransferase
MSRPVSPPPPVALTPLALVARHRRFFGGAALAAALAVLLVLFAGLSQGTLAGNDGIDFRAYWLAANAVWIGHSPYAAVLSAGPVGPLGADLYRYPPVLAVLLGPLSLLPLDLASGAWLVASSLVFWAAILLGLRSGGTHLDFATVAWSGLGLVLFFPLVDSLWKGNLEAIEALALALALRQGALAGALTTTLAWLKVAPVLAVPAALVAGGRRAVLGALAVCGLVALSLPLAPAAWGEFPRVLANEISGPTDVPQNFAPAVVIGALAPGIPALEGAVRLLALAGVLVLVGGSLILARRPGGWPLALLAAIYASLLAPGTLWFHYLAILLPFVAYAWNRASDRERAALVTILVLVSLGPYNRLLLLAAIGVLGGLLARLLRPRAGDSAEAAVSRLLP